MVRVVNNVESLLFWQDPWVGVAFVIHFLGFVISFLTSMCQLHIGGG